MNGFTHEGRQHAARIQEHFWQPVGRPAASKSGHRATTDRAAVAAGSSAHTPLLGQRRRATGARPPRLPKLKSIVSNVAIEFLLVPCSQLRLVGSRNLFFELYKPGSFLFIDMVSYGAAYMFELVQVVL